MLKPPTTLPKRTVSIASIATSDPKDRPLTKIRLGAPNCVTNASSMLCRSVFDLNAAHPLLLRVVVASAKPSENCKDAREKCGCSQLSPDRGAAGLTINGAIGTSSKPGFQMRRSPFQFAGTANLK